jgi:hypothetical protein
MNTLEHKINFMRSLRDSQAMIALAYLLIRRAMTTKELHSFTGLSDDAIRRSLEDMATRGQFFKQVGEHGRITWLPTGDTFFGKVFQSPLQADSGSTTTTTTLMVERNEDKSVVVVDSRQSPLQADSGIRQSPHEADSETLYLTHGVTFEKNLAACRFVSIGEPMASKLSRMDHVAPELIKAHVDSLCKGETIGLAIRRIQGDELPRTWLDQIKNIPNPNNKADKESEEL